MTKYRIILEKFDYYTNEKLQCFFEISEQEVLSIKEENGVDALQYAFSQVCEKIKQKEKDLKGEED